MNKPKHFYHGSVRKIKGSYLLPRQPKDLGENPENLHYAVYATNVRNIAIAMAIISCKGVNYASLGFKKKPFGIIYEGWPQQDYIYLYILPSEPFKQEGGSGNQWYSLKPIKPSKFEKLLVKDYIYLVRKATNKERKQFFKKYRERLRKKMSFK